jgi:hypothetical protein
VGEEAACERTTGRERKEGLGTPTEREWEGHGVVESGGSKSLFLEEGLLLFLQSLNDFLRE